MFGASKQRRNTLRKSVKNLFKAENEGMKQIKMI